MAWWGWLDSVKDTGSKIAAIIAADLNEFSSTITDDTVSAIRAVSVSEDAQQSGGEASSSSSFSVTGLVSSLFSEYPAPDSEATSDTGSRRSDSRHDNNNNNDDDDEDDNEDDDDEDADESPGRDFESRQWAQLRHDSKTYLEEPDDAAEFQAFLRSGFDLGSQENTQAVSQLLASDDFVRNLHAQVVPTQLSYSAFWARYFFRAAALQERLDRRAAVISRASRTLRGDASSSSSSSSSSDSELPVLLHSQSSPDRDDHSTTEQSPPDHDTNDHDTNDHDTNDHDTNDHDTTNNTNNDNNDDGFADQTINLDDSLANDDEPATVQTDDRAQQSAPLVHARQEDDDEWLNWE